jgi:hypothetical protein
MSNVRKLSEEQKSAIVNNNDYVLLVSDIDGSPSNKIVSVETLGKNISGGANGNDSITIKDEGTGELYRGFVNSDRKLAIFPDSAINGNAIQEGANLGTPFIIASTANVTTTNNTSLVINQIYGGGDSNKLETACSHGFIELYNNCKEGLSLNGLYLFYKDLKSSDWDSLKLRGYIPPHHSFLIRGNALYNESSDVVRLKIKIVTKIGINIFQMKVFLYT